MLEILPILAISIVTGFLISKFFKKFDDVERFTISLGLSFLLYGGISLLLKISGIDTIYSLLAVIPVIGIFIWKRPSTSFNVPKILLIVLILSLVVRLVFQNFVPIPWFGDSYAHYLYAESFTTENWYEVDYITLENWNYCLDKDFPCPVDYRPPFFNFSMGFLFNIFGPSFYVGKLFNVVVGMFLVLVAYIFGRKLFNEKAAIFAAIFVAFNPILIGFSFETEVRMFSAYLVLTSLYFFLKEKTYWPISSIFAGLAYLTHMGPAAVLILTVLIYALFKYRKDLFNIKTLVYVLIFLVVISPLLIRNYLIYENPFYSGARYHMFAIDANQLMKFDHPTLPDYLSNPISEIFETKIASLALTIFPLPISGGNIDINPYSNLKVVYNSIIATLGIPLSFLAGLYIYRKSKTFLKDKDIILIFLLLGILMAMISIGYRASYAYPFIFAQIILLIVVAAGVFSKLKNSWKKIFVVLIVISLIPQFYVWDMKFKNEEYALSNWIKENVESDEVIMIRWTEPIKISYFTDVKSIAIPYESQEEIINFARERNVTYLIVDNIDFDIAKNVEDGITLESLKEKLLNYKMINVTREERNFVFYAFKI